MYDDLEIRQQIADVFAGNVNLATFEDWLSEYSWDLEAPSIAHSLASDALRVIAELENGDWQEEEAVEQLASLSSFYWFEAARKVTLTGSDAGIFSHDQRLAATGRSPAAECA